MEIIAITYTTYPNVTPEQGGISECFFNNKQLLIGTTHCEIDTFSKNCSVKSDQASVSGRMSVL